MALGAAAGEGGGGVGGRKNSRGEEHTHCQEAVEEVSGHLRFEGLLDGATGDLLVLFKDEVSLALIGVGQNLDEGVLIGAQFGLAGLVQGLGLLGRHSDIYRALVANSFNHQSKETRQRSRRVVFDIAHQGVPVGWKPKPSISKN